jgi:hypothetical protein
MPSLRALGAGMPRIARAGAARAEEIGWTAFPLGEDTIAW